MTTCETNYLHGNVTVRSHEIAIQGSAAETCGTQAKGDNKVTTVHLSNSTRLSIICSNRKGPKNDQVPD